MGGLARRGGKPRSLTVKLRRAWRRPEQRGQCSTRPAQEPPKQRVEREDLVVHDQAMGLGLLTIEVRDQLANAELTYQEVGATADDLPAGYHQLTRSVPIGHGHQVFTGAGDAVRHWQVQLGAGLQVSASAPTAVAGAVVILGLGIGSLRLQAPCRVVYTVDEPRRRGFAYGTLTGHPESGEEAFIIEHHADDTVSFKVTAFSRPATRLAKIAGPVGAVVQRQITVRYLQSLSKIARQLACNSAGVVCHPPISVRCPVVVQQKSAATASPDIDLRRPPLTRRRAQMTSIDLPATRSHRGDRSEVRPVVQDRSAGVARWAAAECMCEIYM